MSSAQSLSPEALKLLKTLSRANTFVAPDRGGSSKAGAELTVIRRLNSGDKRLQSAPAKVVRELERHQLIARNSGQFVLSNSGKAFLRRKLARTDAFRQQHQSRAIETADIEGVRRPALVDETESPLGWLRRRKGKSGAPMIDGAQFEAGERLRRDFFHAGLTPRVTASWDGIPGDRSARRAAPGASTNLREQTVAAQQRVRRALEAVGPDLASILIDVCCHLKGLEEAEKAKGWPRRSAKLVLQIALTELARHYGLLRSAADAARDTSRGLVQWGAPDYKPQL